jgi:hypothetical protein
MFAKSPPPFLMKKIVLSFAAVFVCVASTMAIRVISATTNSLIAVLLPANRR